VKNLNPDVPDSLVAVINKALAKEPNDRYQTAAQMAAALRNVLGQGTASGRTPTSTMVEDATMNASKRGTTVEKPYAGTVVESTPLSSTGRGTMVDAPSPSSQYSTPAPPMPTSSPARKRGMALPIIAVVVIGLICVVGGGALIANQLFGGTPTEPPILATDTLAATEAPLVIATEATATISVTDTPSVTATPSIPPGIPFVRINSIAIEGNNYAINFETFEYTPALPGMHVHFFWNTVSPQNAGSPGSGPWDLYGGPSPYTGMSIGERPSSATQICALVANSNHSIQPNSGNCVDLP
jgi:hypothetical protein